MVRALSAAERQEFRQAVGSALRRAVREGAQVEDPAELEVFAAGLVPLVLVAGGPPGAAEEIVSLIGAEKGGRRVLRAMAAAAPPPLSALAREAAGAVRDAEDAFGRIVPERAWSLDEDEDVVCLLLSCRRPGLDGIQLLAFTIETAVTGGALKDAFATPMLSEQSLEEIAQRRAAEFGIEPVELAPGEAVGQVTAAARRSLEVGLGPTADALPAVALLVRATGAAGAEELLEGLAGLPSLADEIDALETEPDEAEVEAEIDAFLEEFHAWTVARAASEEEHERACWVAGLMADYRAWYADGNVTGWNAAGVTDFLLGWIPRKVDVAAEDVAHVPMVVAGVLRYLGEAGHVPPARAESLARRALALGPDFERAACDPARFGLAKGISLAMAADGVDLGDEAAVQAWIDGFNARPREERERLVPLLTSLPSPPQPPPASRKRPKKARKAQKQARRRSRRPR